MKGPEDTLAYLKRLKEDPQGREGRIPVVQNGLEVAHLLPVTRLDVDRAESIQLLARWREAAAYAFPSQFQVTTAGTQRWLVNGVLELRDRLLFWVTAPSGERLGHMGLFRFDFGARNVEVDNIVRGERGGPAGLMYFSLRSLIRWTFETLEMEAIFLRVYSDNERAISLYERCGFHETMRMPLARIEERDSVKWVEVTGEYRKPVHRYFVTMRLVRTDWADAGKP